MNILCVPPKTLSAQQKGALSKRGIVIIETDNPEKIRLINPEVENIDSSDWFMAALHALQAVTPMSKQELFCNNLYKRLKEKESTIESGLAVAPTEQDSNT